MVVLFPELSTEEEEEEGDDEDGSSDEFTDSIEEDDDKVTTRSLASIQVKYLNVFNESLYQLMTRDFNNTHDSTNYKLEVLSECLDI